MTRQQEIIIVDIITKSFAAMRGHGDAGQVCNIVVIMVLASVFSRRFRQALAGVTPFRGSNFKQLKTIKVYGEQ